MPGCPDRFEMQAFLHKVRGFTTLDESLSVASRGTHDEKQAVELAAALDQVKRVDPEATANVFEQDPPNPDVARQRNSVPFAQLITEPAIAQAIAEAGHFALLDLACAYLRRVHFYVYYGGIQAYSEADLLATKTFRRSARLRPDPVPPSAENGHATGGDADGVTGTTDGDATMDADGTTTGTDVQEPADDGLSMRERAAAAATKRAEAMKTAAEQLASESATTATDGATAGNDESNEQSEPNEQEDVQMEEAPDLMAEKLPTTGTAKANSSSNNSSAKVDAIRRETRGERERHQIDDEARNAKANALSGAADAAYSVADENRTKYRCVLVLKIL